MTKRFFAAALALVMGISLLAGCRKVVDKEEGSSVSVSSAETSSTVPVKEPVSIRLVAAGDNLIHSSLYKQAKARANGEGYDFNYAYAHVKPLINGDINILNQETIIACPPFEPSNYPLFCTPTQVGDLMIEMGFNVFTLANNHMLDKGTKGIQASLDYWDGKNGILTAGCFRNQAELEEIRTITKKDVKVGFVSATEHTNGLSLPKSSEIKILYTADEAALERQIKATKAECDVVVAAVHWGTENSTSVNAQQKALAQKMAEWGADLIIGTHPHVLQKMEYIERSDGGKTLVAYSIGNFVSAMNRGPCMLGGLLDITLTKNYETGKTTIDQAKLIPLVNHYERGYKNVRVYPFSEYTPELAKAHGVRKYTSAFDYAYIEELLHKTIDEEFLADQAA